MTFLADIRYLQKAFQHSLVVNSPAEHWQALELRNLLLMGELVATATLRRNESRGGHYREDFRESDDHHPVRALILSQAENETIQVKPEVIDFEWFPPNQELDLQHWC